MWHGNCFRATPFEMSKCQRQRFQSNLSVYFFVLTHQPNFQRMDIYRLKPILTFTCHLLNSKSIILKALYGPLLCTTRCTSSPYTGSKLISSTAAAVVLCNGGLWEEKRRFVVTGATLMAVASHKLYALVFASSLEKIRAGDRASPFILEPIWDEPRKMTA